MFSTLSSTCGQISMHLCKANMLISGLKLLQASQNNSVRCNSRNGRTFATRDLNFNVEEALEKWTKVFEDTKIPEPQDSIAYLLAHTLNTKKLSDVFDQKKAILSEPQLQKLHEMCKKKLQRMPVQYIIGEWDFRGLNLTLRPPVFIPWPETVNFIDVVKRYVDQNDIKNKTVLELCCGSGAICLALLNEIPKINMITLDKSVDACKLCLENANKLGLNSRLTIENKLMSEFQYPQKFDLIVSNPPYVPSEDVRRSLPETMLYEDQDATNGGPDGMNMVKEVLKVAGRLLNPSGCLIMEVHPSHPELIAAELMKEKNLGLRLLNTYKDANNLNRYVELIKE